MQRIVSLTALSVFLVLVTQILIPCHLANAALPPPQAFVSDASAGASAMIATPYASAITNLGRVLVQNFPGVKSSFARWDEPFQLISDNPFAKTYQRTVGIVVESDFGRMLPPSLFQLQETRTDCVDLVNCAPSFSYSISGPYKSYGNVLELASPPKTLGSLLVSGFISPVAGMPNTVNMSVSINIQNRAYTTYLRFLFERGQLRSMPVESEVLKGFSIWSRDFLAEFPNRTAATPSN